MSDELNAEPQNTLRDTLEANFKAAEDGTLDQPIEAKIEAVQAESSDRARDEKGKFAPKEQPVVAVEAQEEKMERPTTWKKENLVLWDKISQGQALTPEESKQLAKYSQQREREFSSGVSTYRAEAENARRLQSAIEPFLPTLQQHNIPPDQFIQNLGKAHQVLVQGSPQQKLHMFAQLAQEYGVPLAAINQAQNGQVDPLVPQLMSQFQQTNNQLRELASWKDQQENQQIAGILSEFEDIEKYPHFEMVRGDMARLLESGFTQDLKTAYNKAVRMNDDAWSAEQSRQATVNAGALQQQAKAAAAVKAKANAISPRSTTPTGTATNAGAKDRRAMLAESLAQHTGRV